MVKGKVIIYQGSCRGFVCQRGQPRLQIGLKAFFVDERIFGKAQDDASGALIGGIAGSRGHGPVVAG